jgi:uncharacterized glyoxalase superfamily protein PhnB
MQVLRRKDLPTMLNNRSMPKSTVIPVLGYANVREAVSWLTRTFGFVERLRIGDHRAQLRYGEGDIVVTQHTAEPDAVMPAHAIMVRVPDVDAHFAQAKASGATIIAPPTTFPYGERRYTVKDSGGHVWTFSQAVADVDPSRWGGELVERDA